jgi:hypothetical protein
MPGIYHEYRLILFTLHPNGHDASRLWLRTLRASSYQTCCLKFYSLDSKMHLQFNRNSNTACHSLFVCMNTYSGRKITARLGNVRGEKDGKGKGEARWQRVCLSMYSITENTYCSQLSSVAILLQPEPNCFTSYNTRKWLCSLSLCGIVLRSSPPSHAHTCNGQRSSQLFCDHYTITLLQSDTLNYNRTYLESLWGGCKITMLQKWPWNVLLQERPWLPLYNLSFH